MTVRNVFNEKANSHLAHSLCPLKWGAPNVQHMSIHINAISSPFWSGLCTSMKSCQNVVIPKSRMVRFKYPISGCLLYILVSWPVVPHPQASLLWRWAKHVQCGCSFLSGTAWITIGTWNIRNHSLFREQEKASPSVRSSIEQFCSYLYQNPLEPLSLSHHLAHQWNCFVQLLSKEYSMSLKVLAYRCPGI